MAEDKLYRFQFDGRNRFLVIARTLKDALRQLHARGHHGEPIAYQRMQGQVIYEKCETK